MKGFLHGIRSSIFGIEDGLVSISGLILGVSAGTQDPYTVVLAGLVGAIPAALSMAAGDYLSSKSKLEVQLNEMADTQKFVKRKKERALKSMEQHYIVEGLHETEIKLLLRHLSKDHKLLAKRLEQTHGFVKEQFEYPVMNAVLMFSSFIIGASIIIFPFLILPLNTAQATTFVLTILALFSVGAAKTRWTAKNWFRSGIEMLAVGGGAALLGYIIGRLFQP